LVKTGVLGKESIVLELGCGISGLIALVLGPLVTRYVLTDQPYVAKFVEQNLRGNGTRPDLKRHREATRTRKAKSGSSSGPKDGIESAGNNTSNIHFRPLDWETDEVTPSLSGTADFKSFDVVIACDCIYNEALIQPLVQTCRDVCKLRNSDESLANPQPCLCIVAQQLRSPDVFEAWIKAFRESFRTWRVPDTLLPEGLQPGSGFVVHVGILRDGIDCNDK
jgi:hypothetical protein